MKKKIESLTDEQKAQMPRYVEGWTRIGLCTDPANRAEAEAGLRDAYEIAGLKPPQQILWAMSPMGAFLILKAGVGAGVRDGVRAGVRDGVWAGVWAGVRAGVGDGVWDGVWDGVKAGVWAGVGAGVRDGVWDGVWAGVGAGVGAGVWDKYWSNLSYGQHDAHWLAFYIYFRDVVGLTDGVSPLRGWERVAKSANWVLTFENIAIICDRPCVVAKDNRGRLHREDGAAVEYRDGWGIYRWHGLTVPEDVILHPEGITVERIDAETNAEVRRVMIERYGSARYMQDGGAKVISAGVDNLGFEVVLYSKRRANDSDLRMVKLINSTPEPDGTRKEYWLRTPPHISDALEAKAWTQYQDAASYRRDMTQET